VRLSWPISAGEFFELLRPAALLVSALLSTWVLASARNWRFSQLAALAWAIAGFLLPFAVIPIYLIARYTRRRQSVLRKDSSKPGVMSRWVRYWTWLPIAYAVLLLSCISVYLYRDYSSVDAHLARASQAKVMNQTPRAVREYRAALLLDDDPHTHKLLGIELAAAKDWAGAVTEFRAAERGGEPDELLNYDLGQALQQLGQNSAAIDEYEKFLGSAVCTRALPDERCAAVQLRVHSMRANQRR